MRDLAQRNVDDLLGPTDRLHSAGGKAAGQRIDLLVQFPRRHDVVDQADAVRLGGGHQVAGEQVFLGAGEADQLRPDQCAAVTGDEAGVDVRVANLRRIGGNDDV